MGVAFVQGLHQRLEEGNLDPKEIEIAKAGQVRGGGEGVEGRGWKEE